MRDIGRPRRHVLVDPVERQGAFPARRHHHLVQEHEELHRRIRALWTEAAAHADQPARLPGRVQRAPRPVLPVDRPDQVRRRHRTRHHRQRASTAAAGPGSSAPMRRSSRRPSPTSSGTTSRFGHADLLNCTRPTRIPASSAIGMRPAPRDARHGEYGDVDRCHGLRHRRARTAGAVSSPNAIRSGHLEQRRIRVSAGRHDDSYVLNSVSSHSGLRVGHRRGHRRSGLLRRVPQSDRRGRAVRRLRLRPLTACVLASTPGVRVLRLEQQDLVGDFGAYFKGVRRRRHLSDRPHASAASERIDYHAGRDLHQPGDRRHRDHGELDRRDHGVVSVTRPVMPQSGELRAAQSTRPRPDRRLLPRSATPGRRCSRPTGSRRPTTFQWYRDVNIGHWSADRGTRTELHADRRRMSGTRHRGCTRHRDDVRDLTTRSDPDRHVIVGVRPDRGGRHDPLPVGSVSVTVGCDRACRRFRPDGPTAPRSRTSGSATRRRSPGRRARATRRSWPTRGTPSRSGPVGSKPDFLPSTTFSGAEGLLDHRSAAAPSGPDGHPRREPAACGDTLSVNSTLTYPTVDGPVASPTLSYQWYRTGVAIAGCDRRPRTPCVAADLGQDDDRRRHGAVRAVRAVHRHLAVDAGRQRRASSTPGTPR